MPSETQGAGGETRRWIVVDPAVAASDALRYLGFAGWQRTVGAAGSFDSEATAERHAQLIDDDELRNRVVVRPVRPARAKAVALLTGAQAEAAALRAELDACEAALGQAGGTVGSLAARIRVAVARLGSTQRELDRAHAVLAAATVRGAAPLLAPTDEDDLDLRPDALPAPLTAPARPA